MPIKSGDQEVKVFSSLSGREHVSISEPVCGREWGYHKTYLSHEGFFEKHITSSGIDGKEFGAIKKEGWFYAVSNAVPLLVSGADGNYTCAYNPHAAWKQKQLKR